MNAIGPNSGTEIDEEMDGTLELVLLLNENFLPTNTALRFNASVNMSIMSNVYLKDRNGLTRGISGTTALELPKSGHKNDMVRQLIGRRKPPPKYQDKYKTITKVALHPLAMDVLTVPSQFFFARVTSTAYC